MWDSSAENPPEPFSPDSAAAAWSVQSGKMRQRCPLEDPRWKPVSQQGQGYWSTRANNPEAHETGRGLGSQRTRPCETDNSQESSHKGKSILGARELPTATQSALNPGAAVGNTREAERVLLTGSRLEQGGPCCPEGQKVGRAPCHEAAIMQTSELPPQASHEVVRPHISVCPVAGISGESPREPRLCSLLSPTVPPTARDPILLVGLQSSTLHMNQP